MQRILLASRVLHPPDRPPPAIRRPPTGARAGRSSSRMRTRSASRRSRSPTTTRSRALGEAVAAATALGVRFVPGTEISVRPPLGLDAPARLLPRGARRAAGRPASQAIAAYRGDRNRAIVAAPQRARLPARVGRRRAARAGAGRPAAHRGGARRRRARRDACRTPSTAARRRSAGLRRRRLAGPEEASSWSPRAAARRCSRTRTRCAWATPSSSASSAAWCGTGCAASSASGPTTTTRSARSRCGCVRKPIWCPTGGSDWHGRPGDPGLGDAGPVPLPGDTLQRLGLA